MPFLSKSVRCLGSGFVGARGRLATRAAAFDTKLSLGGMKLYTSSATATEIPEPGKTAHFMIVVNNEDHRAETAVLNKMSESSSSPSYYSTEAGLNVMTIVGGADTTLVSLMHPNVRRVVGVDMNPSALHLVWLKLAVALSDLTTPQAMGFLAHGHNGRKVLRESLLKHLPDDSAEFFLQDELDKDIYHGILRKDNDNPFNQCIRKFLETEHGLYLSQFDTMSSPNKQELLRVLSAPESEAVVYSLLEKAFLAAPWFKNLPEDMQTHLLSVINLAAGINMKGIVRILQDSDSGLISLDDYYTNVLRYGQPFVEGGSMALPPWLTDAGRSALCTKKGSLDTVRGKMEEVGDVEGAPFDLMTLSNCYDFVPKEVATSSVKALASKSLKNGGSILVRRATAGITDILADAGGVDINPLHYHDHAIMFYRHPDSIASASFSTGLS